MSSIPYVYVALLDVLAYRGRLQADRDSGTLSFKDDLQRAMTVLGDINEADFQYQAISDTIIITCPRREGFTDLLGLLKGVFVSFLKEGLLLRGGVAYSQHFKSSHVTYSHAIALAYELESRQAVYPRIVIDRKGREEQTLPVQVVADDVFEHWVARRERPAETGLKQSVRVPAFRAGEIDRSVQRDKHVPGQRLRFFLVVARLLLFVGPIVPIDIQEVD